MKMKEKVFREVCNNSALKARIRQSLSDGRSARKTMARNVLPQVGENHRIVMMSSVRSDMGLRAKEERILQALDLLLRRVDCTKKLQLGY